MQYISTRGKAPALGFEDTMLSGLARDGGLYVPETIPTLSADGIRAMHGLSYEEIAFRVMRPFVGDAFTDEVFADLITKAYAGFGHDARAPLVQLGNGHFLLELFHGPTLAFKDFAMQLIGQMFQEALSRSGKRVTIVGATSLVIPGPPPSRRSGDWMRSMCSSSFRTDGCPTCSAAR